MTRRKSRTARSEIGSRSVGDRASQRLGLTSYIDGHMAIVQRVREDACSEVLGRFTPVGAVLRLLGSIKVLPCMA